MSIVRLLFVQNGGLTICGSRLTLYMIMEFLKTGYSWDEIRDEFRLTFRQTDEIREFLEDHREEEYEQVVALAESNRRYWEERNRERFEQIAKNPLAVEYSQD